MKILILSWRGPGHPHAGGAEYSSHEHAKGWVRGGHNVTLFTSFFKDAKKDEDIDGVHIIRRGSQIFGVHLQAFLWYLLSPHPKFDMVVDEIHGIPFFTPLYVRKAKLAFIHEVAKEVWSLNPWPWPFHLIPALLGTYLEPLIFKTFYRKIPFMTVSQSTKNDLTSWGIPLKNITVVNNGFKVSDVTSKKKEERKTLLFLGALSKDKGIEDALLVFRILFQSHKDWQFWVIGKGEIRYLKYLQNKCKEYGIYKEVKFFGFVSEKKKYEFFSRAHVLINPSIREGWGLVVIEAASVGTPTVAYNVPGLRDSVIDKKTGLLSDVNPQDCAEKIDSLLGSRSLYNRLSKNCQEWSKQFSWDKASSESLKLIERITQPANS